MASRSAEPVVIIPCDHRLRGALAFQTVGEKYILGVTEGTGCLPLLLPVLGTPLDLDAVLSLADGLLLTGSPSNVAPHRYGGPEARASTLLDEARDATSFSLIGKALATGVPLLAICRGFQELNVALGGTLHQHLEELPGRIDHRANPADPVERQYAPVHPVAVTPGGALSTITGLSSFDVNSLHSQGIDRLAPGLVADAQAPDGTVEAVWLKEAGGFALGVQWHPEWELRKNRVSQAIFTAFGDAIRSRAKNKDRS
jgi:putative glutamine amidotransferase